MDSRKSELEVRDDRRTEARSRGERRFTRTLGGVFLLEDDDVKRVQTVNGGPMWEGNRKDGVVMETVRMRGLAWTFGQLSPLEARGRSSQPLCGAFSPQWMWGHINRR